MLDLVASVDGAPNYQTSTPVEIIEGISRRNENRFEKVDRDQFRLHRE